MSTYTENYDLIKPDEEDFYDVQNFNENMDSIDMQMALTEEEIAGVSEKIGTSEDEITNTVFGKLKTTSKPPSDKAHPSSNLSRESSTSAKATTPLWKSTRSTRQNVLF